MNYDRLIKNIDVLNNIKINEKLLLFEYTLSINNPSCYRPIYRYLNKQNRDKIYIFIIKLLDDISLELCKFNMYNMKQSKFKLEELNIKSKEDYFIIYKKMDDMKCTLGILNITYSNDKEYVRKIDMLKNRIFELNPEYRRLRL